MSQRIQSFVVNRQVDRIAEKIRFLASISESVLIFIYNFSLTICTHTNLHFSRFLFYSTNFYKTDRIHCISMSNPLGVSCGKKKQFNCLILYLLIRVQIQTSRIKQKKNLSAISSHPSTGNNSKTKLHKKFSQ